MKKIVFILVVLLLCGCKSDDFTSLGFNESQNDQLNQLTSIKELKNQCRYLKTVKILMDEDTTTEDLTLYCEIPNASKKKEVIQQLRKQKVSYKDMKTMLSLPYYRNDKTKRYIKELKKVKSAKKAVLNVNLNLDIPYYSEISEITNTNDMLQLVNKFSKLPDNFAPNDLVETPSVCMVGEDYSCFPSTQYIRKEVADHFEEFVLAAKKEGFTLKSIASLRNISYQKMLYNYYKNLNGQAYADSYFARPGQSEHNSALAIDVTFNQENYENIALSPYYPWFKKHMADYGFILRYPKGKEKITGFNHESWHIRYVGKKAAKKIMSQNITLEEYLAKMPAN